jgi:hypothetical protein
MIAASSQKAQKKIGSAKKLLGKGITYNPASGILYHQYGVLYDEQNNMPSALGKWRDGIFNAPSFRTNYYEAATTYYKTTKPIWAIIYGEVFVNKEQLTPRSYETRKMLIAAYRKFFSLVTAEAQEFSRAKYSNPQSFEDAVVATLAKLSSVVSNGYSTENLIMLRTRFIIDWQKNYASRYPFSLFEYHDEMLREGVFDAYNQWLFGRVENAVQYQHWIEFHKEATPTMQAWIDKHPLQFTTDDAAYNTGKISSLFP